MGCNCGNNKVRVGANEGGLAVVRDSVLATLSALGDADPCPTTRIFTVIPAAGAYEPFRSADYGGDALEALDAALDRLAVLGAYASLKHGCR